VPGKDLWVTAAIRIPAAELELSFARSSGPGGQNVNKVNSKAVLRWNAATNHSLPEAVRARFLARYSSRLTSDGSLVLSSDRFRDQRRNIEDCEQKLREMLLSVSAPPKLRRETKPSRGSARRRVEGKRIRSGHKESRRKVSRDD
jgi:ribosome-associated protein